MARYQKILPMVDSEESTFAKVRAFLENKGFRYENSDGEWIFRKGDGFWVQAKCVKLTYQDGFVRLEAWVSNVGNEMDLEGFVGSAGKKPLKKIVAKLEEILAQPGMDYVPQQVTGVVPTFTEVKQVLPEGITKREYIKHYAGDTFRRQLKGAAIFAYVLAGVNLLFALLASPAALVDVAILLGLGLGMHLGKSKLCAIGLLVYGIVGMVFNLIINGVFSGWLLVIMGVFSVMTFTRAEKRYKELTAKPVQ